MKIINYLWVLLLVVAVDLKGQEAKSEENPKVILITLDGLRWQELFTGADKNLVGHEKYVDHPEALKEKFWRKTAEERREALLPFIWSTVKGKGQIHGNRSLGNKMNLTNQHWFSYPGYNEILSGRADDERINSNDKIPNPNRTILEKINDSEKYKGKVVAFGSWDVFPSIINEERSGIPVNAGFESARGSDLTHNEEYLNKLQKVTPSPWGSVRLDVFTHHFALEVMKKSHPDLIYISYGETDDFAHDGNYEAYLQSANTTDGFIKELWEYVQSDPYYKNNTTILISTDHGRGTEPLDTWRSHGKSIAGADQVWLIALGRKIEGRGEMASDTQFHSDQIAATVAELMEAKVDTKGLGAPLEILKNE
jgi:hypothetical protein